MGVDPGGLDRSLKRHPLLVQPPASVQTRAASELGETWGKLLYNSPFFVARNHREAWVRVRAGSTLRCGRRRGSAAGSAPIPLRLHCTSRAHPIAMRVAALYACAALVAFQPLRWRPSRRRAAFLPGLSHPGGASLAGFSRRDSSGRVHAVSRWASPSSSARSSSAIWCRKSGRARPLYQRHRV